MKTINNPITGVGKVTCLHYYEMCLKKKWFDFFVAIFIYDNTIYLYKFDRINNIKILLSYGDVIHLNMTKALSQFSLLIIKNFLFMDKIPKLEINCIPSQLNTSQTTGVSSQLANLAAQQPNFDGVTIDQMRGNPIYGRGDDIDKVGMAQKVIADNVKVVKSRAKVIRALNDAAQKYHKPNAN